MSDESQYNIEKNGWNKWSEHVLFQLKALLSETKELRDVRVNDREFLIESIRSVDASMTSGMSELQATFALMQQKSEQKIALLQQQSEKRAEDKALRRASMISLSISIVAGIAIILVTLLSERI